MSRELPAIARKLRDLRERQRFSQEELARRANLSPQSIAKIEAGFDPRSGKPVNPTPDTLRRIADALSANHPEDAPEYYRQLMEAAGYLDGLPEPTRPPSASLDWARSKPALPVITRAVRDHPDIPPHLQEAITRILQASEEIDRDRDR